MEKFVFLVTSTDQLSAVSDFIIANTSADHYLDPDTGLLHWIAQYRSSPLSIPLPSFMGFSRHISAHQPLLGRDPDQLYQDLFPDYTLLPIDIIDNPDNYPEYFI